MWVRCCSLHSVVSIRGTSWPSLGRSDVISAQVKQCAADDEAKKVQVAGKDLAAYNKATRNKDAASEKAQRAEAKAAREESEKDKLKTSQTRKLEQRLEAVTKVFGACSNGCKELHACTQKVAYVMVERDAAKVLTQSRVNLNLTWSRRWRPRETAPPRRRRRGPMRVYASRECTETVSRLHMFHTGRVGAGH